MRKKMTQMFEFLTGIGDPHWKVSNSSGNDTISEQLPDLESATKELQDLLPTRPDIGFLRTDEEFLHRFLKAKKHRVADAFNVLCRYYEFRQRQRDICVGLSLDAPGVRAALEDGTVGVLSEPDAAGRPIVVVFACNWDPSKYDVRVVYQTVLLTLEFLVDEEKVQKFGVVAVVDWSDFPAKLATSLSPRLFRTMLDGLQVFSHGNNLHKLQAHLLPRLLPAELGGERGEYNASQWAAKLLGKARLQENRLSASGCSVGHSPRETTSCGIHISEEEDDEHSTSDKLLAGKLS